MCDWCYNTVDEDGDALEVFEIKEGVFVCSVCCQYHKIEEDYLGRSI